MFLSLPEEGTVENTGVTPFSQDDVFADRLWKGVWHESS